MSRVKVTIEAPNPEKYAPGFNHPGVELELRRAPEVVFHVRGPKYSITTSDVEIAYKYAWAFLKGC